ncbi:MAG: glycoside hydrolase family 2 protein [Promethearchaeota archaeon]
MDIYLDGTWNLVLDPENIGIQKKWYSINWVQSPSEPVLSIKVPSSFNTLPGLNRYAGTVWYIRKLPDIPYRPKSHEYSIEFEGSNYYTQVWLNGNYLGDNYGGFLPFRFIFNPRLIAITGENYLVVRVSNALDRKGIPAEVYDWYNWGGIHRSVKLLILEKTRIIKIKVTTKVKPSHISMATVYVNFSIKNTQEFLDRCYAMQIEPQAEWELYYLGRFFDGEQQFNQILIQTGTLEINPEILPPLNHISHDQESLEEYFDEILDEIEQIDEIIDLETYFSSESKNFLKRLNRKERKENKKHQYLDLDADSKDYNTLFHIDIQNPSLWTPDTPDLYLIKLHLNGIDEDKEVRFGIRQIEVKKGQIILNNRPIRLIGAAIRDEKNLHGMDYLNEIYRRDILRLKSLGMNTLYPSYYPHVPSLLDLADEEGILIFSEIPMVKNIRLHDSKTRKLAMKMIYQMINRDYNHPSVILWIIGNEIDTFSYFSRRFLSDLIYYTKHWDPSRLISVATNKILFNGIHKRIDVVCKNLQFNSTYGGLPQFSWILDTIYSFHRRKPVIITQFASSHNRKTKNLDNDIAEFQFHAKNYLISQIKVAKTKPFIQGMILGILRDYRSPLHSLFQKEEVVHNGFFNEKDHPRDIVPLLPKLLPESSIIPKYIFHQNLPANFHFNVFILRYFLLPFEILTILKEKIHYCFLRLKARHFYRPVIKEK